MLEGMQRMSATSDGNKPNLVLKPLAKLRTGKNIATPKRRSGLDMQNREPRVEICEEEGLPVRWINIERAESVEIDWLHRNYEFNPLHLDDVTSYMQRPKLDDFDDTDYLFLVLHFPVYNKSEKVSVAEEVDIFLGPDYIITVHDGKLNPLNRLFEQCKNNPGKRHGILSRSPAYTLYKILDILVEYVFPILNKLSQNLDEVDSKIFQASSQATIYQISTVRRDILAVRRILKPQISVLSSLERRKRIVEIGDDDLEPLYADITDHINKVWDNLEEFREVIESLCSTYDSLNTHRLNMVIKTLTMISVIMLPLTVITGFWGMNVKVPFQGDDFEYAFLIILGLMFFSVASMLAIFKWRKWL